MDNFIWNKINSQDLGIHIEKLKKIKGEIKMNKKEFDEKYVGKKLVVNCKTEELANEFLELAESFGYKWRSGRVATSHNHWDNSEAIAYDIAESRGIGYATLNYYKTINGKIVEFKSEKLQLSYQKYKLLIDENKGFVMVVDKNNNTGEAKCLSTDKFDIGFGVKLAKARLDKDKKEVQRLLDISNRKPDQLTMNLSLGINTTEMENKLLEMVDVLRKL